MKKLMLLATVCAALTVGARIPHASGPIGIYGIVEKVVFEPSEQAPERLQVWGAFAYTDGVGDTGMATSPVRRGYLYFTVPAAQIDLVKKEWADLKAVAGTGQAIAFGSWLYIGGFGGLDPAVDTAGPPYVIQRASSGNLVTDMRVRPATETPAKPSIYQTNAGIVRLSAEGNHSYIVKELRAALAANGGVK
jgi:hypothetical protein